MYLYTRYIELGVTMKLTNCEVGFFVSLAVVVARWHPMASKEIKEIMLHAIVISTPKRSKIGTQV